MPWKVVERKIGRAGGVKQRTARQQEWDRDYGEGNWTVGYFVDGAFVLQEDALESIYYRSYEEDFAAHPEDLAELVGFAKSLRNPHAEATTGVDLQSSCDHDVPGASRTSASRNGGRGHRLLERTGIARHQHPPQPGAHQKGW
jgi:hypothetical protein